MDKEIPDLGEQKCPVGWATDTDLPGVRGVLLAQATSAYEKGHIHSWQ